MWPLLLLASACGVAALGTLPGERWRTALGANVTVLCIEPSGTNVIVRAIITTGQISPQVASIYALDAATGALRWSHSESGYPACLGDSLVYSGGSSALASADGSVQYLFSQDTSVGLVALNSQTGLALWSVPSARPFHGGTALLPALLPSSDLVVLSQDTPGGATQLLRLSDVTGTVLASTAVVPSQPWYYYAYSASWRRVILAGVLLVSGVSAYDIATGALLWTALPPGGWTGSVNAYATAETVWVQHNVDGGQPQMLSVLSLADGSFVAQFPVLPFPQSAVTYDARTDTVRVGSDNGLSLMMNVYAGSSGQLLWSFSPPTGARASPCAYFPAGDAVSMALLPALIVNGAAGEIIYVDSMTGETVFAAPLPNDVVPANATFLAQTAGFSVLVSSVSPDEPNPRVLSVVPSAQPGGVPPASAAAAFSVLINSAPSLYFGPANETLLSFGLWDQVTLTTSLVVVQLATAAATPSPSPAAVPTGTGGVGAAGYSGGAVAGAAVGGALAGGLLTMFAVVGLLHQRRPPLGGASAGKLSSAVSWRGATGVPPTAASSHAAAEVEDGRAERVRSLAALESGGRMQVSPMTTMLTTVPNPLATAAATNS
jgi:outer membrane protein assembly factor BamB